MLKGIDSNLSSFAMEQPEEPDSSTTNVENAKVWRRRGIHEKVIPANKQPKIRINGAGPAECRTEFDIMWSRYVTETTAA